MPTFNQLELRKTDDKRGGKNNGTLDGYYEDTNGTRYFIKQPQEKMELFTELFAGLLLQEFKQQGLIDDKYHRSLICADCVRMDNGSYALIQPNVDFLELYHIIGTGYEDGSDRNPVLEMLSGASYYPVLAQRGYYYGLSTCLMFSLLLGDYSVHSGNVVRLSSSPSPSSSSCFTPLPADQYARIDWGAAFRHFAHPDNNVDLLTPLEYQGVCNHKGFTKGYLTHYKNVPGLYPSIVNAAVEFKNKVSQDGLLAITLGALRKIPVDLLDQGTKIQLAEYMSMPAFSTVRFGDEGSVHAVAEEFVRVFMLRLERMETLTRQLPNGLKSPLSGSAIDLTVDTDAPFSALMADWKGWADVSMESPSFLDFSGVDVVALRNKFNQYVSLVANQAEIFNLWSNDPERNTNLLVPYYHGDHGIYHGSAFVSQYRESVLLRRLYTLDSQSSAAERLHHYELANKAYIQQVSHSYWIDVTDCFHAAMGIINAVQLLQKPEAALMPELHQGFYEQLQIFARAHSQVSGYLPATSAGIDSVHFGSHCFYPVTDSELDAMSGPQLATICLEELNADAPGPLVARIINHTGRWQRMLETLEYGCFNTRTDMPDKLERLVAWRSGLERFLSCADAFHQESNWDIKRFLLDQLSCHAEDLPECLKRELSGVLTCSVEELKHEREQQAAYTGALAVFESASQDDKFEINKALQGAFNLLPDILKPLFERSASHARNEAAYLECLQPDRNVLFDKLGEAYDALTSEQKQRYHSIHQPIQDLVDCDCIQANFPVANAHARLQRLQALHIDSRLQNKLRDAALSDPVFWSAIGKLPQACLPVAILQDLLTLKAFCDNKRALNSGLQFGSEYTDSINLFYRDTADILVSDRTHASQFAEITHAARRHFQHRHSLLLRLFADVLLLLSSFVGIGIYLGSKRVMEGKSYFFTNTPTTRKREFTSDWMKNPENLEDDSDATLLTLRDGPSFNSPC